MGDLSQANSASDTEARKNFQNFEFGAGGIVLGLLLFILALFTLNYFRIISLSSLYSELSILPQKELSVGEKAKTAGYYIVWQGDPNDTTGRTILASSNRKLNDHPDDFGWSNSINYNDPNKQDFYRGMGIFKGWENILNSKDTYMVLIDPVKKTEIKVRILKDKKSVPPLTNDNNFGGNNMTRLFIENLNYGPSNQSINSSERFDYFLNISSSALNKLIKIGDVVIIYTLPLSMEEAAKSNFQAKRDEKDQPIALNVVIRRFSGKAEVTNEIQ